MVAGFLIKRGIEWLVKRRQKKRNEKLWAHYADSIDSLHKQATSILLAEEITDYSSFKLMTDLEFFLELFGAKFDDMHRFAKKVHAAKFVKGQDELLESGLEKHAGLREALVTTELKLVPDHLAPEDLEDAYSLMADMGFGTPLDYLKYGDVDRLAEEPVEELTRIMKRLKEEDLTW